MQLVRQLLPGYLWAWTLCTPSYLLKLVARCYASGCSLIINYNCDSRKDKTYLDTWAWMIKEKHQSCVTGKPKVTPLPGNAFMWLRRVFLTLDSCSVSPSPPPPHFPSLSPSSCEKLPGMIKAIRWNKSIFLLKNMQVEAPSFCLETTSINKGKNSLSESESDLHQALLSISPRLIAMLAALGWFTF